MQRLLTFAFIIPLCLLTIPISCQVEFTTLDSADIEILGELPDILDENSGNVLTPYGTLIGHNDSGSKPRLYEYTKSGQYIRKIKVEEAKSKDWEDITADANYIYISDTGNNAGKRERLSVYRIPIPEQGNEDIELNAERIRFEYADRVPAANPKLHNYDCESLIVSGDSLFVFTKNRGDKRTKSYGFPAQPGEYAVNARDEFNSGGLITGADLRNGHLVLVGYNRVLGGFQGFIWIFWDFEGNDFFKGKYKRHDFPYLMQTEAVLFVDDEHVVVTNEEEEGGIGRLHKIHIDNLKK